MAIPRADRIEIRTPIPFAANDDIAPFSILLCLQTKGEAILAEAHLPYAEAEKLADELRAAVSNAKLLIATQIAERNYALVCATKRDTEPEHFIIFQPDNAALRRIAGEWLAANLAGKYDSFSVNVGSTQGSDAMAEMLVSEGRIIPI